MKAVIKHSRAYFWPVILANTIVSGASTTADWRSSILLGFSICLLASYGFLLNDLWDLRTDGVNQPGHFENMGVAGRRRAALAAVCFLVGGISIVIPLGSIALLSCVGMATALTAYSVVFRSVLLLPTLTAAGLATAPIWLPSVVWTAPNDPARFLFVVALVLAIAGRETLMDVRDLLGDAISGRDTLATVFGSRIGKLVSMCLTASACLLFLIVASRVGNSISPSALLFDLVTVCVLLALIVPMLRVLRSDETLDARSILVYVTASRRAMALTPLWLFLLLRN